MSALHTFVAFLWLLSPLSCQGGFQDQIAQFGVCEKVDTKERRCVMQPAFCNPSHINGLKAAEGERFVTAHQQKIQGNDSGCTCENTPSFLCLTPRDDNPSLYTKKCVSDVSQCDVSNGSIFGLDLDDDISCTCQAVRDKADNVVAPTMYGACRSWDNPNEYFCAYARDDCESGYYWVQPEDTFADLGTQCTCELVRTGGCVGGFTSHSGSTCAVTAENCVNSEYFGPVSLKKKHGESCRLCQPSDATSSTLNSDGIDAIEKEDKPVVGIIIASILGAVIMIALVFLGLRLRGRSTKQDPAEVVSDQKTVGSNEMNLESSDGTEESDEKPAIV